MKRRTATLLPAIAIGVLALTHSTVPGSAQATSGSIDREHYPGPLDWRYIAAYQRRLSLAKGPTMDALRKKIAAGPKDLAREIAATRKLGMATSVAELKLPKWPAAQDARKDYLDLYQATVGKSTDEPLYEAFATWSRKNFLTADERAALKRGLEHAAGALRIAHRAAAKQHCTPTLAMSDADRMRVSTGWRAASTLLRAESLSLALEGKHEAAIRNQALGLRVLGHAAEDPIIISYLVGGFVQDHTITGFSDILTIAGPDAGAAAAVKQVMSAAPRLSLERALRGELAWSLDQTRAVTTATREKLAELNILGLAGEEAGQAAMDDLMEEQKPGGKRKKLSPLTAAERKFAIEFLSAVDAATLPVTRKRILVANLDYTRRRGVFARFESIEPDPHDAVSEYVADGLQVFGSIDIMASHRDAQRAVLLAACDVMTYAAREGKYPENLATAGQARIDPFTGRTLSYRREGDGFVVHSVGPEGNYTAKPGEKKPLTAVFRYPPVNPPDVHEFFDWPCPTM